MQRRLFAILLAICMVISMATSAMAADAVVTVTLTGAQDYGQAQDVVALTNQERSAEGLGALTHNASLNTLAMQRAAEIAVYFAHELPDGTDWETFFRNSGFSGYTNYGENIAVGYGDPEQVLEGWMTSEGHRANILTGDFTQIGVGCYQTDGIYYWVQLFSNSTTDTATTDRTDRVNANVAVDVLASRVNASPSGTEELSLEPGQSSNFSMYLTNAADSYFSAALVPLVEGGSDVADAQVASDGTVTVTARNAGTASISFPAYSGQTGAYTLNITVAEPEPPATEPPATEPPATEPPATEPPATEPPATEPPATEPPATEPPATEPPATEPPPTDPDPTVIVSGVCGENLTCVLDSNGVLTISGTGPMHDYNSSDSPDCPWKDYKDAIVEVVLEPGVTRVGFGAFKYARALERVSLPDTLTSIGGSAFSTCDILGALVIPESVTEIGPCAFEFCYDLKEINLPKKLTELSDYLFRCSGITQIEIPEGVTTLGYYAFERCDSLEQVNLPDSVVSLGGYVFSGCKSLKEIQLPAGITQIPNDAFNGTALEEIVIPEGVTTIGSEAFRSCLDLKTVILPESVTVMHDYCFMSCNSLTTVDLPGSLTEISWGMFQDSGLVELEIPYGVSRIDNYGFNGCENLERLVIPGTVTKMGYSVFDGCDKLTVECWENTYVQRTVQGEGVPYKLLPETGNEPVYNVDLYYTDLGTATISTTSSPVGRYITVEVFPDSGEISAYLTVYYDSEVELDLQMEQTGDNQMTFLMPPCDVWVEIQFMYNTSPFVDVDEDDYFYTPVLWAYSYGITAGVDENHFGPNRTCTRAEVVTFLWRAFGKPEPVTTVNPFVDVKPGDYYYKAVLWAVENGITVGIDSTHFGPGRSCTRAQVVSFLWRAAGKPKVDMSNPFVDVKPSDYYYDAVLWAAYYSITSGTNSTHFAPGNPCTRGQVVSFLYRAFNG